MRFSNEGFKFCNNCVYGPQRKLLPQCVNCNWLVKTKKKNFKSTIERWVKFYYKTDEYTKKK